MTKLQKTLQLELEDFYKSYDNIRTVVDLVLRTNRGPISLRLLDYFVVNYASDYAVAYPHPKTGVEYTVSKEYENQMRTFHKQLFDPFRRGTRAMIVLKYTDQDGTEKRFNTTMAQLNFFKWMIENGILKYIETNRTVIVERMKEGATPREKKAEVVTAPPTEDDQSNSFEVAVHKPRQPPAGRRRARGPAGLRKQKGQKDTSRTTDVSARRTPLNGKRSYLVKF